MKTAYYDEPTRSIIDLVPPGELYTAWTISRVSVLPPYRGKGIARRLMNEVTADADREGEILYLDVHPMETGQGELDFQQLLAFYTRCGFQPSRLGLPTMIRYPRKSRL